MTIKELKELFDETDKDLQELEFLRKVTKILIEKQVDINYLIRSGLYLPNDMLMKDYNLRTAYKPYQLTIEDVELLKTWLDGSYVNGVPTRYLK